MKTEALDSMRVELLDHGYLELIDVWGSDQSIVEGARMSTGKGFLGWGEEEECSTCNGSGTGEKSRGHGPGSLCPDCQGKKTRINKPGDEKLLKYLWDNKHSTPFEMAGATFEVQAPIFIFREWHRHRVPFGYSEASARYAPLPDLNYIPTVERLMMGGGHLTKQAGALKDSKPLDEAACDAFRKMLEETYERAEHFYQWALSQGVPKELARIHLPVGRYSKMRATGNLRGWLGFLALRNAPTAQYEIRVYAEALQNLLAEKFPRTLALAMGGK